MQIFYTEHSKKRMKQRGITHLETEHILQHPIYVRNLINGRCEAVGEVNNRRIKVVFVRKKNFINVITVI
jgi:uncharacterized DUF497 family protein